MEILLSMSTMFSSSNRVKDLSGFKEEIYGMLLHFRSRVQHPTRTNLFSLSPSRLQTQTSKSSKTLNMASTPSKPKRLVCPSCSKAARTCVCNRFLTRNLDNKVSVTILQHSSERNHHLNSTRIARLGLKNVNVITVFEVDFEARFEIRLLEPDHGKESSGFGQVGGKEETQNVGLGSFGFGVDGNGKSPDEKNGDLREKNGEFCLGNDVRSGQVGNSFRSPDFVENLSVSNGNKLLSELTGGECGGAEGSLAMENHYNKLEKWTTLDANALNEAILDDRTDVDGNAAVSRDKETPLIRAMMVKYGCISDLFHIWKVDMHGKKPKFDHILTSPSARDALAGGFIVKKIERKKLNDNMEIEENEEFEVKIPPGSILLFPSQNAVGVDDLKSIDFEVKNLIVLDGTWTKAGRIYNENPWLKLLPHLRLDLDKMSLYAEVRHQPKAGYLSTIESIVYTLKALGDNTDGLDNLLDVFESMVGDQRRFRDDSLSKG